MIENRITDALNEGKSVAVHYKDVGEYMELDTGHKKIYLENVNPAKEVAAEILSEFSTASRNTIYKKYTTNEIVQEIRKKTKNRNILLVFNDLQQTSKSSVRVFLDIMENLQILCSIRGGTKKHHNRLLKKLVIMKDPEDEVIDITLPIVIFAGSIAFMVYLKIALSLSGFMAYIVLASIWFGTIIARTLLWIKK